MQTRTLKNICILGMGGVGGYFGGRIANAIKKDDGVKIYFIARGEHLREIQANGLTIDTSDGEITCHPDFATDDISSIPPPDLVLLCTKSYDLDNAVKQLVPKMNEKTIVVPLLNGVDIYDRIRKITDKGIVLPSCAYVVSHIGKPGLIVQRGPYANIFSGCDPQKPQFISEELISFFSEKEISFRWNANPFPAIWEKYIFIASYGLVTAYCEKPYAIVNSDEKLLTMVENVMKEVYAIAKAKRINLPADIVEKTLKKGANIPPDSRTSYQRDVETKGKLNEGDIYGEAIERMGKETGTLTPVTSLLYAEIQNRFK
jgi:2-dehydropantoate 2-reductase